MKDFKTLHLCIHGDNTCKVLENLNTFTNKLIREFFGDKLVDNCISLDENFDYEFIKEKYTSIANIFDRYLKEMEEITNES